MSVTITNLSSVVAQRHLGISQRQLALSLERLSSGLRINRGADDPAGLIVSERLRAEIAAVNQASYEVGGDYYEFIPLGDGRWGVVIADVVGKGIAAALLVSATRASLASLASLDLALRAILRKANRFFHESVEEGKYVTLFYAVLDVPAKRLIYVNAGHLPPIVLRREGRVELLQEGGVPLGLFDEPRYSEGFATLKTGDLLALYTDGITEASNAADEPYGESRLIEVLENNRSAPAATICARVMNDVRAFGGATAASDDRTLVILRAT